MGIMPTQFDDRGVSEVVGAILVFGILIAALGVYQAFIVPSENAGVEFDHSQDVRDDMVDVRAAILDTASTGDDRHTTLRLGTQLPNRIVAVNPPDPTGELWTSAPMDITIQSNSEIDTDDILSAVNLDGNISFENQTRFLNYEPHYRDQGGTGTLHYENTIVYSDHGNDSVIRTDQSLVENDTVNLYPLVNEYYEEGAGRIGVDFKAGFRTITRDVQDAEISLPTRLDEDTWEEILESQLENGLLDNITVTEDDDIKLLNLTFDGNVTIVGAPVGIRDPPTSGSREELPEPDVGGANGPGDDGNVNPSAVFLTEHSYNGSTSTLKFYTPTDSSIEFVGARFNLYIDTSQGDVSDDDVPDLISRISVDNGDNRLGTDLLRSGPEKLFNDNISIPGDPDAPVEIQLTFSEDNGNFDFPPQPRFIYGITFITDDGQYREYLVGDHF